MGMLFQNGALLTDIDVFENVAFPLREHTDLPESLIRNIVLTKLQAVGLRGAARLMPSELSGGMARRVALARAMATDPEVLIYDEPFTGLDPISMGMIVRLVRQMNYALGITSIVVSHDVEELSILADTSYIIAGGKVAAAGTLRRAEGSRFGDRQPVHQRAAPTARCRFTIRRPITTSSCSRIRMKLLRELADNLREFVVTVGAVTLFLGRVLGAGAARAAAAGADHRAGPQRRRAVAGHHHDLRPVRRRGARPAGLRPAAALRLRRCARHRRGARA